MESQRLDCRRSGEWVVMFVQNRNNSGFTLIEITLVVLLIAILTAVGIPSFRTLYQRSEIQKVASQFSSTLRYAQQRAVMERVPIRVVINVDDKVYWVPVEKEEERRHYRSRSYRRRPSRAQYRSRSRVREVQEIRSSLPEGFIFEFVYKVATDREIQREGEIHFYPDGSADAAYITILRLAKEAWDENRVFIKISPATGVIKSMEGTTQEDGSEFYRGMYDDPNYI